MALTDLSLDRTEKKERARHKAQKIFILLSADYKNATFSARIAYVAKELAKLGYSVSIFTLSDAYYKTAEKHINFYGVKIKIIGHTHYTVNADGSRKRIHVFACAFEYIKIFLRLRAEILYLKPDIINLFTTDPLSLCLIIYLKLLNCKTTLDIDDSVYAMIAKSYKTALFSNIFKFLENNIPLLLPKISVSSNNLHKKYRNSYLLPNMVYISEYLPKRKTDDFIKIAYLSTFGLHYHHKEFVEWVPYMLRANNSLRFIFMGAGELLEEIKQISIKLNVCDYVKFYGMISHQQVLEYLSNCDIGVCILDNNDFDYYRSPIKLLEYMAARVALVTNDIGEPSYLCRHLHNAFLVPSGDIKGIAEGILYLSNNDYVRTNIAENAYCLIKNYNVYEIMPLWIEFYDSIR